jgi:hypothetical protein
MTPQSQQRHEYWPLVWGALLKSGRATAFNLSCCKPGGACWVIRQLRTRVTDCTLASEKVSSGVTQGEISALSWRGVWWWCSRERQPPQQKDRVRDILVQAPSLLLAEWTG